MSASPGCWRLYTELGAGSMLQTPRSPLTVDAYAITHPGVPGPQSTPSVWIHLATLCFILERGWPVDQAIRLRRMAADAFERWPWLDRPDGMGDTTVVDVARAVDADDAASAREAVEAWIDAAWGAWFDHHAAVRARADELAGRFLDG
jgi:hypothetical protein